MGGEAYTLTRQALVRVRVRVGSGSGLGVAWELGVGRGSLAAGGRHA